MLRRLSWLPLRTSLVLAALAAVALVALTFGLLRIVSANSAEIAHVRAEAEAEILASKIASLPAGLSDEERDGEILTLVAARALEAQDAQRCDGGEQSRAILLARLSDGTVAGTHGIPWPTDAGPSNRLSLRVPSGTVCQTVAATAFGSLLALDGDRQLLVARTVAPQPALTRTAYLLGGAIFLGFAALAAAIAWALTRSWQTRLAAINRLLDNADRNGFTERADVDSGPPELRLLSRHLNALLGRAEDTIGSLRRLHRHVAHDLRGPLMVARKRLESVAGDQPVLAEIGDRLTTMDKRCRALLGIIDAEAAGQTDVPPIDPNQHIARLIDDMFVYLAEDKELEIQLSPSPASVRIHADLFDRMMENLLGNAVKFANPGSTIDCQVETAADRVTIRVENDGPSVADANRERIFEPGYSDAQQGRDGHGLGLALVKTVAVKSGGKAYAYPRKDGFGIAIDLPLSD